MRPIVARAKNTYYTLTKALITKRLTVSTMESCTSGCIASLITDTEGASTVLPGSIITYSNSTKEMFGVPKEIIEEYGVYSKETAEAMARAAREMFGTNIGIGVTGSLGRIDPMNSDSEPGVVHYAIDINGDVYLSTLYKIVDDRYFAKYIVAENVGRDLLSMISYNGGVVDCTQKNH